VGKEIFWGLGVVILDEQGQVLVAAATWVKKGAMILLSKFILL
jgi:hypothetical protein